MDESEKYAEVNQEDELPSNRANHPWEWKRKVMSTKAICFGFFSLSVGRGMIGPTLPDIEILIQASTAEMSYILAGRQLGYILGNALGGSLYKLCNTWILLLISTMLSAPFMMIMPWMTNAIAFGCLITAGMFFTGFMIVGNMAITRIWGEKQGPYMQALHCIYFAGYLLASLMSKPFLSAKSTHWTITNGSLVKSKGIADLNFTENENVLLTDNTSKVQIPFMLAGGITLLASLFYIIMLYLDKRIPVRNEQDPVYVKRTQKSFKRATKVTYVTLIFFLLFSYTSTEINYSVFLSIFMVQSYGYTTQEAAVTLSVYFTTFVVGRFIGIFASKILKPQYLLAMGIILTIISNIMMYFAHARTIIAWITICIAALGMSTQYSAVVSWTTEYIDLAGWAGTTILLSGATGYLVGPFLFGSLFNFLGINSFMYILSSAIILETALFIVVSIFVRFAK